MGLLASIINPRELASLSEQQLDVLVATLDAEIMSNAAVKRAVSAKIQGAHKSLTGGSTGAQAKKGGGAKS